MDRFSCIAIVFVYVHLESSGVVVSMIQGMPEYRIAPETISNLFNLLEKFGETDVKTLIQAGNIIEHTRQFLSVAVISKDELFASEQWKSDDIDGLVGKGRARVFINKKVEGQKKTFHGEMQFLTNENEGMNSMITKLKQEKGKDEYPYIIMFSYYIPCAYIKGISYSCSEELANIAHTYTYQMLIGYGKEFNNTNVTEAKRYLNLTESISAFSKMAALPGGYELILYDVHNDVNEPFQKRYFDCLLNKAISVCCTSSNEDDKRKIVAVFVNNAAKACTENSRFVGRITRESSKEFLKCINTHIEKSIGNDCEQCKNVQIYTKFMAKFCAYTSVRDSPVSFFGQANTMHDTTWEEYRGAWKNLYSNVQITPGLLCLKGPNSVESMCSDIRRKLDSIKQKPGFVEEEDNNLRKDLKKVRNLKSSKSSKVKKG